MLLSKAGFGAVFHNHGLNPEDPDSGPILKPTKTTKAYLLAVAYCATFGGTGTLVGTATNLTFKGVYEQTFPDGDSISFTQWSTWAMIPMIINVISTWLYVQIYYLGLFRPYNQDVARISIGFHGEKIAKQVF